jgi:arylsulfatase A-like enzyme
MLIAIAAGGLACTCYARETTKRPNIVIILADDMGFSDIGCYGGEIQTPNLDGLAQQGVRFSQFYNNARCCPTRASLLTGLYPHQAGVGAMCQDLGDPAYRGQLSEKVVTIAEVLRDAGYRTGMVGKWHLSNLTIGGANKQSKSILNFQTDAPISPSTKSWPCNRGFEEHFGTIAGVGSFFDPYSLVHNENLYTPPADFYYTDFINDKAADLIDQFAAQEKPFFLYVAETAPHWPLHAKVEDIAKYSARYEAGWDQIRQERYERQMKMGLLGSESKLSPRNAEQKLNKGASVVGAWEDAPNKAWQARRIAVYAAMIDRMDQGIGRILHKLGERGIENDTLVMFLSDNGACAENLAENWYDIPNRTRSGEAIKVGNDPAVMPGGETTFQSYGPAWANASNTPFRRFKHWTEEGGISAPFIARWPAQLARHGEIEKKQVGHVMDLMPTCLAAAGVEFPKEHPAPEGKNLLPALRGDSIDRGALFWEHEGNRAARVGKWKLVAAHDEPWQLFDIEADRTELNDLAAKMPDKVNQMQAMYREWTQRCGVKDWPVRKPTTHNAR